MPTHAQQGLAERRKNKKLAARVLALENPYDLHVRVPDIQNIRVASGHVCIKHGIRLELTTGVLLEDTTAGIHLL